MKKHLQPLTPAALYARVSSDRQDVDLSVSTRLDEIENFHIEIPLGPVSFKCGSLMLL